MKEFEIVVSNRAKLVDWWFVAKFDWRAIRLMNIKHFWKIRNEWKMIFENKCVYHQKWNIFLSER